ncbi:MAG: hypothetical protein ACYTGL_14165 [Planctomycetota bacterium]|jgi:hypothetical protein
MSTIGAAGGGTPINPYGGSVRAAPDTDAAKTERASRASAISQEAVTGELSEPDKTESSGDRDADGFYAGPGLDQEAQQEQADEQATQSDEPHAAAEESDPTANHAGERVPCDGHSGTMIDFDV